MSNFSQKSLLSVSSEFKTYYVVQTSNGRFILKDKFQLKVIDAVYYVIYATTKNQAEKEFYEYVKQYEKFHKNQSIEPTLTRCKTVWVGRDAPYPI